MQIKVIDKQGKESGRETLPKEIFGFSLNKNFLHRVIVLQTANRRIPRAKTKDRSEVRGGGRKPWRQKGTGRARHGSIRSPLWIGGGVTFGPSGLKKFSRNIPKAMGRKALLMALSAKAAEGEIILVDDLDFKIIKTKAISEMISKILPKPASVLIILPSIDKNIILSARNLPKVNTTQAKDLNALDILSHKYLLMPKESIRIIKETFLS